ncbi:CRM-domain containing factor CFM3A, chloroplastic/mitochondrial-like protein [Drosera capensis]
MSVVAMPPRPFHPSTFTDPITRFHRTPIRFFHQNIDSNRFHKQNPRRVSSYGLDHNLNSSSGVSWFVKWNQTHLQNRPKTTRAVLDYGDSVSNSSSNLGIVRSSGGGGSTMEKIVERLRKGGNVENEGDDDERGIEKGSIEEMFYVEEGTLPDTRGGFSENKRMESVFGMRMEGEVVRFPWEKPEGDDAGLSVRKSGSRNSKAEMTLSHFELTSLWRLGLRMKNRMTVGGAGVTQDVVETIHKKWRTEKLVKLTITGPPALNMKRTHDILEKKTGGMVIYRSGTSVWLYRGDVIDEPASQMKKQGYMKDEIPQTTATRNANSRSSMLAPSEDNKAIERKEDSNDSLEARYEDEIEKLLDELGPRYLDWPGGDPLPVDADMLPSVVPGYEPPYRLLPYGVKRNLGMKEATALQRIARALPPHFALGRSRQLEGLAKAMVKLWEKTSIAKVALKRGVQLTTSERMAEELKKLTGGILLSHNKDFLVFYRGKNFLSSQVTEVLLERERLAKAMQDQEELARLKASASVTPNGEAARQTISAGTLAETLDADARWGKKLDDDVKQKVLREAEVLRHANLVRKLERKLAFAERKIKKAETVLGKVEAFLNPADKQADPQSITEEERFMFRKLGLRMKAFLLLGRRGIFDGTVENMHMHWKYRELIKIIVKSKDFQEVKKIALSLEAESGGVLVSVDKIPKGYVILVFRGKNYQPPSLIRPKNLLTKRKALSRSIELQRREAQMELVKNQGDSELYDRLDSSYSLDDEDTEDEDEAESGFYDGLNDEDDTNQNPSQHLDTSSQLNLLRDMEESKGEVKYVQT